MREADIIDILLITSAHPHSSKLTASKALRSHGKIFCSQSNRSCNQRFLRFKSGCALVHARENWTGSWD